jgi:LssY-like putative type I secretion system component LssY
MHAAGWFPADPITLRTSMGFSHDRGQVTHHMGPDIDAERDLLMHDLGEAGMVQTFFQISGTGPTLFDRNGEGDPYCTTEKSTSPGWSLMVSSERSHRHRRAGRSQHWVKVKNPASPAMTRAKDFDWSK